ncbi:MAG TPA: hypothetical protein DCY59_09195 [Micrococcaceae bacterium]|nr:hypothetical protein [Micrococcaceae bacterium]
MATQKQVTEPAASVVDAVTEPAQPERVYDPRKMVRVMDAKTKQVIRRTVPETWLDGRFPNLIETPSQKAGN